MKLDLVKEVEKSLNKHGFDYCEYLGGCFDVAARRERVLLLKILSNIDSFQQYQADYLKILSRDIMASPLLIGEKTRREWLENDVIYERFGLLTLNLGTFNNILEGDQPRVMRLKGGLFGEIDSEILRELRKEKGLTQKELAEKIGVTKKSIYEHEASVKKGLLEVIKRLEELFGKRVSRQINPFEQRLEKPESKPKDRLEVEVRKNLEKIGFETDFVSKAPFNVIAMEKAVLLSGTREWKFLERHAPFLKEFSELTKKPAFLISDVNKDEFFDLPIVKREELKGFEKSKDLIKRVAN